MSDLFSLSAEKLIAVFAEFSLDTNALLSGHSASYGALINDTRQLKSGDVFCAVIGHQQDGRDFIEKAISQGAGLVLSETTEKERHGSVRYHGDKNTPIVEFYLLNQLLYDFASAYYQTPQQSLSVIGITGTNGKTTTSHLVAQLFDNLAELDPAELNNPAERDTSCAVIGTLGAGKITQLTPTNNTTPAATELFSLFERFKQTGVSHVAMEVSSHALAQHRVNKQLFSIAVFTNLSRDHLDYHHTMAEYAKAKFAIFAQTPEQIAIVNGSDQYVQQWLNDNAIAQPVIVFGQDALLAKHEQHVIAQDITLTQAGIGFTVVTHLGEIKLTSTLLGRFNVDNMLAAIAVLIAAKVPLADIARSASQINAIAGRMESFYQTDKATAVVDYAHTPEALESALLACQQHCQGDLWVVFGCGGDRDKGKRGLMGQVAQKHAQHIIITNDNPRNEVPEKIANDILSGCQGNKNVSVMLDRQQAVLTALSQAKKEDMVLLAGKGHEKNIVIGDEVIAYNEREFVRTCYSNGALS